MSKFILNSLWGKFNLKIGPQAFRGQKKYIFRLASGSLLKSNRVLLYIRWVLHMPIGSRVKLERVKENHKPTKDKPWDSEQDLDKNSWINPMRWDNVDAISPSFHLSLKTKLWDLKNYIENIWKSCLKSASQFLLFSEEIWTSQNFRRSSSNSFNTKLPDLHG